MQYPYIPNSNKIVKKEMLDFVGVKSIEEIYNFIPNEIRMKKLLDIPEPLTSEIDLKKYMNEILNQNSTCEENISFLGAGCYNHYIPAVVDEIINRSEFLTAYSGDTYADHGKLQTFFEYASMMGELLNCDVVSFPTYDGGQAASTSMMMSRRINGRRQALVPENMNPNLLAQMKGYCEGMELISVKCVTNGQLDIADLKAKLGNDTACVFIQNPCFLGFFEQQCEEIGKLAHSVDAEFIVYANPSTLGVIAPPADYGADISCGEIQPLGIHMSYGAGTGGYIATRQEEKYVVNYPQHLHNIYKNFKGQFGYGRALPERTSYYVRDKAVEYLGTLVGLWSIAGAAYLAIMGPDGMKELGENIIYKCAYARKKLTAIKGITLSYDGNAYYQEFVINFDNSGKTVEMINKELLKENIFGGYDLSRLMPELGQAMLVCVTEKTNLRDIDRFAKTLNKIL